MSEWFAFDDGRSSGKVSSEGSVILRDEKHPREALARETISGFAAGFS